jgi:hypothetical protein
MQTLFDIHKNWKNVHTSYFKQINVHRKKIPDRTNDARIFKIQTKHCNGNCLRVFISALNKYFCLNYILQFGQSYFLVHYGIYTNKHCVINNGDVCSGAQVLSVGFRKISYIK